MADHTTPAADTAQRLAADDGEPFRVLVTANYFAPGWRAGGPVRSISDVLDTASADIETTLLTRDHDLGTSEPYPDLSGRWVQFGRTKIFYLGVRRPAHWRLLWRQLRSTRFDLLYVNSVWSTFSILPIAMARLGLLRVGHILVAPRGEFGAGALRLHRTRKRIFLAGWRWMLSRPQVLWHAATPIEAADIRRVLPRARIGVIAVSSGPVPAQNPARLPTTEHARLVFIGRISPMKNLDLVLAALAHVPVPVSLDIYGPVGDPGYWQRCRQLLDALPDSATVEYRGELRPDQVRETFSRYDAFVLPTRGENFGNAIAESLSAYCPVVCSDRTPWTSVLHDGGGLVLTELTPSALGDLVTRVATATPEQRHQARMAAGAAYRRWRASRAQISVLDHARQVIRDAGHPSLTAPSVGPAHR
ncbi:glycosyltransferase family 4 protein [Micromonospora sp. NBC_01813]|uniref:glycosyltransferase family 4 protein n=1 Tax=Micromonospora sp. NBC_01813 TaxID=2975988 RepID=UPI002DD95211|nr:glycosyltransferase family 4 protein [Micromonospora sp. NBC_01813]WSA06398.1 glycosyltransferase family 4 protein [Micromonospora sp. NBC_01813]